MTHYDYKGTLLNNIFKSGSTQFNGYTDSGTALQFSSILSNLPSQTLGYENTTNDIGAVCCPRFTKYTANNTHTCNAGATAVYLVLVGGGGGGGSGGSTSGYAGEGGGGGGGGGMLALKVSKSNNSTIELPIIIDIVIAVGGSGGAARTNNGTGNDGSTGGGTNATIRCAGNDIVAAANGGVKGLGGPNINNGLIEATGGAGGGRSISLSGGTANYSNDGSNNGTAGVGGADGTGPNDDISYGGVGGQNAYSTKGFFGIESPFTFGDGGHGGPGDSTNTSVYGNIAFGGPGIAGQPGVAYIFEYFD